MAHKTDYQFTAVPTQLFMCLDRNCRTTLFSLIQLSTFFENKSGDTFDGWFFRTNALLEDETNLTRSVLNGALDALYQAGIIDIIPQKKGRGKTQGARKYKVNFKSFLKYQSIPFEDCSCSHPNYGIITSKYKDRVPSFQRKSQPEEQPTYGKSNNNIDNTDNTEIINIENIDNNLINNNLVISSHSEKEIKTPVEIDKYRKDTNPFTNQGNMDSSSFSSNLEGDITKHGEEPGQGASPEHQPFFDYSNMEGDNTKCGLEPRQEDSPRQEGYNGSNGMSDFLRSITLDDFNLEDDVPLCPPDPRYMNYAGSIQDFIRYDAEPDYEGMTDAEMMDAVKEAIDDALECLTTRGKDQRYWDLMHRAKKIYMHLNGCAEDEAKNGINRIYIQRQMEQRANGSSEERGI